MNQANLQIALFSCMLIGSSTFSLISHIVTAIMYWRNDFGSSIGFSQRAGKINKCNIRPEHFQAISINQ